MAVEHVDHLAPSAAHDGITEVVTEGRRIEREIPLRLRGAVTAEAMVPEEGLDRAAIPGVVPRRGGCVGRRRDRRERCQQQEQHRGARIVPAYGRWRALPEVAAGRVVHRHRRFQRDDPVDVPVVC